MVKTKGGRNLILFKIRNSTNKKKIIDELLNDCYKILVLFLGEPPKKITWQYYHKNKNKN